MSHARNPSTHSQYGAGAGAGAGGREKTYFEQQREALVMDIATSFEHVLANINKLNRGLEATIAVGSLAPYQVPSSRFRGVELFGLYQATGKDGN